MVFRLGGMDDAACCLRPGRREVDKLEGFAIPKRFEVREVLASGDGEVMWRAFDRTLLREVVLKMPGPALAQALKRSGDSSRALREARALARIRHPGIVRLLDVKELPGGPLLVLEPVTGESLASRLQTLGRLTAEETGRLGFGLAEALDAVHSASIVHRGLSVSCISILANGSPCLMGFVLARFSQDSFTASTTETTRTDSLGLANQRETPTAAPVIPAYPAPEQFNGERADPRSDIFGIGCVLYRCLTGTEAFPSSDDTEWKPPKDPRALAPGVSKVLSAIILRCIAKSPLQRYSSMRELADALREILDPEKPKSALETSPRETQALKFRQWPLAVSVTAAACVVALVIFLVNSSPFHGLRPIHGAGRSQTEPDVLDDPARVGPHKLQYEHSHALLIGIGNAYERNGWDPLPNAKSDVEEIEKQLRAMKDWENWDIKTLLDEDATREKILKELARLEGLASEEDRMLVYFAGHGEAHKLSEDCGWIVPADGKRSEDDPSRDRWIPFDDLEKFDRFKAKHILLVMDCCYGGRLGALRSPASAQDYREQFLTHKAHIVISSGNRHEPVSDGKQGENSPFAKALLGVLQRPEAAITSSMLHALVQDKMIGKASQHPEIKKTPETSSGEFVFFLKPKSF